MKKLVWVLLIASCCLAGIWWFLRDDSRMTLHLDDMRIDAVAFAPDGKPSASASADRTVKLWDVPETE